jgi:hypothetical protein
MCAPCTHALSGDGANGVPRQLFLYLSWKPLLALVINTALWIFRCVT